MLREENIFSEQTESKGALLKIENPLLRDAVEQADTCSPFLLQESLRKAVSERGGNDSDRADEEIPILNEELFTLLNKYVESVGTQGGTHEFDTNLAREYLDQLVATEIEKGADPEEAMRFYGNQASFKLPNNFTEATGFAREMDVAYMRYIESHNPTGRYREIIDGFNKMKWEPTRNNELAEFNRNKASGKIKIEPGLSQQEQEEMIARLRNIGKNKRSKTEDSKPDDSPLKEAITQESTPVQEAAPISEDAYYIESSPILKERYKNLYSYDIVNPDGSINLEALFNRFSSDLRGLANKDSSFDSAYSEMLGKIMRGWDETKVQEGVYDLLYSWMENNKPKDYLTNQSIESVMPIVEYLESTYFLQTEFHRLHIDSKKFEHEDLEKAQKADGTWDFSELSPKEKSDIQLRIAFRYISDQYGLNIELPDDAEYDAKVNTALKLRKKSLKLN